MVPYLDTVFDILEGYDSAANLLITSGGFAGRKNMLENLHNTLSERSGEVFEDEVWV